MKNRIRSLVSLIVSITVAFSFSLSANAHGVTQEEFERYYSEHGPEKEIIMDVSIDEARSIAVDYMNETYRKNVGPLTVDNSLNIFAQQRAKEIFYNVSHYLGNGNVGIDDVFNHSYNIPQNDSLAIAENLCTVNCYVEEIKPLFGYEHSYNISKLFIEAADFFSISTEGHYETMICPDYTKVGIGYYFDERYNILYTTFLFSNE